MATAPASATPTPQRVPWALVQRYLHQHWEPGEHFSVIAPTGYGKSYLVTRGLLPMWRWTMILDVKGSDATLVNSGHKAVKEYPSKPARLLEELGGDGQVTRYRLFPGGYSRQHRPAFATALKRAWDSSRPGNAWVVYADEARLIADPKYLGMGDHLDAWWISARFKGLTLIAGTQAPRWVPSAFYEQPRWLALGQVRDKQALRRMAEIGGDTDMLKDVLPSLGWHEFLMLGPRWSVITKLPAGAPPPAMRR